MPELGNLTVCIFLPPGGLSTVKSAPEACFAPSKPELGLWWRTFASPSCRFRREALVSPVFLGHPQPPPPLHRMYTGATGLRLARCQVRGAKSSEALTSIVKGYE